MYMTPISDNDQKLINTHVQSAIRKLLDSPTIKELPAEQVERIARLCLVDKLKDELSKEVDRFVLDEKKTKKLITKWLNGYASHNTRTAFRRGIDTFLSFIGGKNILDVDTQTVDDFVASLKRQEYANNTVLQIVHACSSFFSTLKRWEYIKQNPFERVKLPRKKIEIKTRDQIPTNHELDLVEVYARQCINTEMGKGSATRRRGGVYALTAVRFMRSYGWRLDAISNLEVNIHSKTYKTVSKSQTIKGELSEGLIRLIKKYKLNPERPFDGYSTMAFRQWWRRMFLNQKFRSKVKKRFTIHAIRARFAVDLYKDTKDIYLVSKKLNHANIVVTQTYLSSLREEFE